MLKMPQLFTCSFRFVSKCVCFLTKLPSLRTNDACGSFLIQRVCNIGDETPSARGIATPDVNVITR